MSIEDLIDNIAAQDFAKAEPLFSDLLSSKMADALDQEKINVASQIFNGDEPEEEQLEMEFDEEESDDDIEISDEEMDEAIDDL